MVLTPGVEPGSTAWKAVIIPLDQVSCILSGDRTRDLSIRSRTLYPTELQGLEANLKILYKK